MKFAALVDRIGGEAAGVWDIHYRAQARQARGEDVILLSVGDPDFDTPPAIVDTAVRSLRSGRTHYTGSLGEAPLRRAVAAWHARTTGQAVTAENVAIVPGAQCGLYAAAMCLLQPGDEVVVPEPMYATYEMLLGATGARIVRVPLRPERGFHLDPAELVAAVTDRTRLVFINTPHNPTGTVMRRDAIEAIAEVCRARGIWLLSDEVYATLTFDAPHLSACTCPGMADRSVVVSSLSKSHAMTGWRLGWVVAPAELIGHLGNLMACMLYGSPPFIQDAAVTALTDGIDTIGHMRDAYRARRDLVCDRLGQLPGMMIHRPESGMFVMADIRGTGLSAQRFADELLDREGVSVLPAKAFGPSAAGHIRITYAAPEPVLAEACDRIARYLTARTG